MYLPTESHSQLVCIWEPHLMNHWELIHIDTHSVRLLVVMEPICVLTAQNQASIQTTCSIWWAASGIIPESCILAMKKLGAICTLMLIHGVCPEPLNPLIFHFIIYNGDFNSLHQALIQEWHPDLFDIINCCPRIALRYSYPGEWTTFCIKLVHRPPPVL